MRSRVFSLAALATVLLVASANADDDADPLPATSPSAEIPPPADLPPLPELPPLPDLPPLGAATATATSTSTPTSTPTSTSTSTTPQLLSLPAVSSATLGQYDEYQRPIAAFSIDAAPVSAAAYQHCVAAGRCTRPSCAAPAPDQRVACVDLEQARSYCAFADARLPTEEEWEHAAREEGSAGMRSLDDAAEWTSSPYCFFCGKNDQVVRGGPAGNPALRGWRPPTTRDKSVGFRCAKGNGGP